MTRPVRPIALVILTACMIYPGLSLLFQGVYPFVAGEYMMQYGQFGPWLDLAMRLGIPPIIPVLLKLAVGSAWLFGVLGLWAGDARALPLVIAAAVVSLFNPIGPSVMSVLALIVLFRFREDPTQVPA